VPTPSSNVYLGRTPEAVLGELTSVKDLLHGVDDSIEHLLTAIDTPQEAIPTLHTPPEHAPIAPCKALVDKAADTTTDLQLNLNQADIAELAELLEDNDKPAINSEIASPDHVTNTNKTTLHHQLTAEPPPATPLEPVADDPAQNLAEDLVAENIVADIVEEAVAEIVESVVAQYLPQLKHILSLRLTAALQSPTENSPDHSDSHRTA
jgi:hypothetical protein